MKTIKNIALAAVVVCATSCSDYLDTIPSVTSNAPVSDATHLMALMDYVTNMYEYNYTASHGNDDSEISRELFLARPASFSSASVYANMAYDNQTRAEIASDYLWNYEYAKIFRANLVITSASSVTGDQSDIDEAVANAYFMRAYSYLTLAVHYCAAYSEKNAQTQGVPLRLGIDFEENLSRGTLEETYNQILSDIDNASKLTKVSEVDPDHRWRVSKTAISALYARIYLYRGDFEQALTYAEQALQQAPELYDMNQFGIYKLNRAGKVVEFCETYTWSLTKIPFFQEQIYDRYAYNMSQWWPVSQSLTDTYNEKENDLRYIRFFAEDFGPRMGLLNYYCVGHSEYYDQRYRTAGLTTQEMMLIKAECQARLGQWQAGLETLTPLREKRFVTGTATALTANSADDALKQILAERRRELCFSYRLADLKRFAQTTTTVDDVTITREFYAVSSAGVDTKTQTHLSFKGDDERLILPITLTEINNSKGIIDQYLYDNVIE